MVIKFQTPHYVFKTIASATAKNALSQKINANDSIMNIFGKSKSVVLVERSEARVIVFVKYVIRGILILGRAHGAEKLPTYTI